MVPILLAFSVFALFAAAFIVVNVVTGVVLAGYRDIGVLKAIGFTPTQVTTDLLGQIVHPCHLGLARGRGHRDRRESAGPGAGVGGVWPPADIVDLLAHRPFAWWPSALMTVVVAACVPAWRAGHLDAVAAITRGTAPSRRAGGGRLRRRACRCQS